MTKANKTKLVCGVLALAFFGVSEDIDVCRYTAEFRSCYRVWGLPVPFTATHNDAYRVWMERDLGVHFPQEYVDYLNFHPLLAVSSTPRGNWLYLRTLKDIYDADVASHNEVATLLKRVASRNQPIFTDADREMRNLLVDKYLSRNDPFRAPPKKSE